MKKPNTLRAPADRLSAASEQRTSLWQGWKRFWFTPVPTIGLHATRMFIGALILCWLVLLVGHQQAFFGLGGWLGIEGYREIGRLPEGAPIPLSWSILYLAGTNATILNALYFGSILVVLLFTLGIATRITSILTWVIAVSFSVLPATNYGADYILALFAFYLMIGYVLLGQWSGHPTRLERILGFHGRFGLGKWFGKPAADDGKGPKVSYAANVAIRLLQVTFAMIVLTSGLHKLQMDQWWGGWALWYPLHPPLSTTPEALRFSPNADLQRTWANTYLFFISLACYAVLAWQLMFPIFAWRKSWRWLLIGGSLIGWLGTVFLLGLPLYGPLFFIGALTYLTPEEWQGIAAWCRRWFSRPQVSSTAGTLARDKRSSRVGV